jgi:hypothetical protein
VPHLGSVEGIGGTPGSRHQIDKAVHVHGAGIRVNRVSRRVPDNGDSVSVRTRGGQPVPEPGQVHMDRAARVAGKIVVPQQLDEPIDGQRLAGLQEQQR